MKHPRLPSYDAAILLGILVSVLGFTIYDELSAHASTPVEFLSAIGWFILFALGGAAGIVLVFVALYVVGVMVFWAGLAGSMALERVVR